MTFSKRQHEISARLRAAAGFTLVELMIALVLGLLVIAGVGSVFLANKNAYRTNVALAEAQESARTSFEFLAREIRGAGANPCGSANVASVLNPVGDQMLDFDDNTAIEGWDDASTIVGLPSSGAGAPVAGESAIRLANAKDSGLALEPASGPQANVKLKNPTGQISSGDVLMLCDVDKATIFQVTNYNSNNHTVVHNSGGSQTPGNLTKCLNHPVPQHPSSGSCNSFSPSSYLAIPSNYIWYVGTNADGGHSLYRYGRGQGATSEATEMVRGVWGMTITYHEPNNANDSYVTAAGVNNNWAQVDAARLELTVRSRGFQPGGDRGAGIDGERLERVFTSTVALRNQLNDN
ncbi:MAG: PilW family protein [Halothiobacillaceae bacterium]